MLGWYIGVYRQTDDGASPATEKSPKGARLALWEAGPYALNWLNDLVKAANAVKLRADGYPCLYTATANYLIPRIVHEPWLAELHSWAAGERDVLAEQRERSIDHAAAAACRSDEWLLVEAWDQS